jgi:gliding motility-associated-like protein
MNADNYTWNFAGGTIITENSNTGGPYMISWGTPGLHIVSVVPHTIQGCIGATYFDTVNVHPYPNAHFNYSTSSHELCLEDSVEFIAMDSSTYENSYAWYPEHFFTNNNHNHIWGKVEISGYVRLVVTDPFGCSASDSVRLTPESCCTVSLPTGFSPNNDGRNDHFRPMYEGYHRFHSFRVTNRWGQTVFESTNNKMEWDGTYNGIPQDLGVYYYYMKYDCGGKTVEKKGEITLVR